MSIGHHSCLICFQAECRFRQKEIAQLVKMIVPIMLKLMIFCLQRHSVSAVHSGNVTLARNERAMNNDVHFYLFSKLNPLKGHMITCDNEEDEDQSRSKSYFNINHPTRFIIHDWKEDYKQKSVTKIKKAWLSRGSYNIIAVDWPQACVFLYPTARKAVYEVGNDVATMIRCLQQKYDMSMDTLHVIGFGLGAHVAGHAGKIIGEREVHTIIGLDPSKFLFKYSERNERLSDTDAYYVEVVHTNGDFLGFREPIGTSDFYVNGGMSQPCCDILSFDTCSHDRAVIYYTEAITIKNYGSLQCRDFKKAIQRDCGRTFSKVRIGSSKNSARAEGSYYVPIHSHSPYGMKKFN